MSGCGDPSRAATLVDTSGNPIGVLGNQLIVSPQPQPINVNLVSGGLDFSLAMADAFGRLRVSSPETLFDSKQVYDKDPENWWEVATGAGGFAYTASRASTYLTVTAANGDSAVRQTKRYFNYQPGKALRHGEPVLTPSGWVAIEDLNVGDEVFDGLGRRTRVVGVYPQGLRQLYRVTFDDGTHVDCDSEHLWKTIGRQNSAKGQERVLTTRQMLEEYGEEPPAFARWRIPAAPVLEIQERPVPIDPYTLGAILGDGHIYKANDSVAFTSADSEIVEQLKAETVTRHSSKYGYGLLGLGPAIRELGLAKRDATNKFVPDVYKYNSAAVRLAVLQGLMDTDGDVDKRVGTTTFTSVSAQLAGDVMFLVRSLGGQARVRYRTTRYTNRDGDRVEGALSYRVSVIMPECPFRLGRKAFYWRPRTRVSFARYVHSIKPLCEGEATCIRVESDDHTFITRGHIVTHNSQLIFITYVLGAAEATARRRVGIFSVNDGIFLEQNGTNDVRLVQRTSTSGAPSDASFVTQANWNLDPLNGTGPSGIILDLSKPQVMLIDYEWLGTGLVRVGFVLGDVGAGTGGIVYAHCFQNPNNIITSVYMRSPNQPVRYEIERIAPGPGGNSTLEAICSTVISEGGQEPVGLVWSADRNVTTRTVPTGSRVSLIALRWKTGYYTRTMNLLKLFVHDLTANGTVWWTLLKNPTRGAGTAPSWVSADANAGMEYDITSTEIITGGRKVLAGYAQGRTESVINGALPEQMTLNPRDYAATASDEFVLAAQTASGGGGDSCLASMDWVEL